MKEQYKNLPAFKKADLKNAALVCFRSATELLEDAELLQSMKRYARALFLACIGIEELGKARLALELFELNEEPDPKEFIKFWRHHQSKIAVAKGLWIYNSKSLQELAPNLCPQEYGSWEEFFMEHRSFYSELSDVIANIKMKSLYVDIINRDKIQFTLPSHAIKENYSRNFINDLDQEIKKLKTKIQQLGHLNIPPYETGEIHEYEEF